MPPCKESISRAVLLTILTMVLAPGLVQPLPAQPTPHVGFDPGAGPNDPRVNADGARLAWDSAAQALGAVQSANFDLIPLTTAIPGGSGLGISPGVNMIAPASFPGAILDVVSESPANGCNTTVAGNALSHRASVVGPPYPAGPNGPLDYTFTFASPIQAFNVYITGEGNTVQGGTIEMIFTDANASWNFPVPAALGARSAGFIDAGQSVTSVTFRLNGPGGMTQPFISFDDVCWVEGSLARVLEPTVYVKRADGPFADLDFTGGYFHHEDFEDGALNAPGVAASAGRISPPGPFTDSVDEDDGVIDGSGRGGHSWVSPDGQTPVTFFFSEPLPTHAGIVWTDGIDPVTVRVEGKSDSMTSTGTHADDNFGGGTGEDRFYGFVDPLGIESITVIGGFGQGWEIDHLQYGNPGSTSDSGFLYGYKFLDVDCDGKFEPPAEMGLQGWTFVATNDATGEEFILVSDANGLYSATLPFGTYSVVEVPQAGFKPPCKGATVTVDSMTPEAGPLDWGNCRCEENDLLHSFATDQPAPQPMTHPCWQVISAPAAVSPPPPYPALWSGSLVSAGTGVPRGDYVFECCFCLNELFESPDLKLFIGAHDLFDVYLNGVFIGSGGNVLPKLMTATDRCLFRPGRNCVQVVFKDSSLPVFSIATGSVVTAKKGKCCEPSECPCAHPPRGMKGWWAFDGDLKDTAGFKNHGPSGTFNFAAGAVGKALEFSSSGTTSPVQVPPQADLSLAGTSCSIDAWVKVAASSVGSTPLTIVARNDGKTCPSGFALEITPAGSLQLRVTLSSFDSQTGSCQVLLLSWAHSASTLLDGKWHHVAMTNDPVSPYGLNLYVDGVKENTGPGMGLPPDTNLQPLQIGSIAPAAGLGRIDELEVFNRVLTAAEVYDIWRAGSSGKCKEGCFVPSITPICKNHIKGSQTVTVCNFTSTAQTYTFSAAVGSANCNTNFNAGNPGLSFNAGSVTILPGKCKKVQVILNPIPPAMKFNGAKLCYQVTVTSTSGEILQCGGAFVWQDKVCPTGTSPSGGSGGGEGDGGGVEPDGDAGGGVFFAPPDGLLPLELEIANTGATAGPVAYRVTTRDHSSGKPSAALALNGLEPGVVLEGQLELPPVGAEPARLGVDIQLIDPSSFHFYEVILSIDLEGDGSFDERWSGGVAASFEEPSDPAIFRRGNANADPGVDISDAIMTFGYLFLGGTTPPCIDAADTNDDGNLDISDGIAVLGFLFQGGAAPPLPGAAACGPDPTADTLDCATPHTTCN